MSDDAASLPCPLCLQNGFFYSVPSLRDRLINVSTNKILCPVCQEEVLGLDKLTIHLFSHVKPITSSLMECIKENEIHESPYKPKPEAVPKSEKKLITPSAKNKTSPSTANVAVKFVKIYPKLPVKSVNTVTVPYSPRGPVDFGEARGSQAALLQTMATCDICSIQFVDNNILRMHRCLIHNVNNNVNESVTRYQCHVCPKYFKMRGSLMVHLRVAHYGFHPNNNSSAQAGAGGRAPGVPSASSTPGVPSASSTPGDPGELSLSADVTPKQFEKSDNKQWQCDVCRKCFTTKYFLKKHKRLHTGETPYACTQCNKTFTFQQSYHKHLLYHKDEKPHACAACGRAFKELSTLHNHQRIHTGEKPFSCETCGKCFRQRVSYLVHRRIHTGVMPYKCTACDKSFRYKVSQRTHKCQAQPPGTVVRQSGDLVEKLKRKHPEPPQMHAASLQPTNDVHYHQISEANAQLVRSGAKLSLEDTEEDNFTLIAEAFSENNKNTNGNVAKIPSMTDESNISLNDKNVPSPSEILKNLYLSKEDDFTGHQQETEDYTTLKDFNFFL